MHDASQDRLDQKLRFLKSAGTGQLEHSERDLLSHLLGTRQLLESWGARPALCDAGLFHSVYGTEHYETTSVPASMRKEVEQLIGRVAEALVWIFCSMRRETFDANLQRGPGELQVELRSTGECLALTHEQFHDLINLTFANTLEAFPRLSWRVRRSCRAYLRPFRGRAMSAAQEAFDKIDAPRWAL